MSGLPIWPIPYGDESIPIEPPILIVAAHTPAISSCLAAALCPGNRADRIFVSLSTSEAEYVAAAAAASQCGQEVFYLREILGDFGFTPTGPTRIYEDNLACVAMSGNPVRRKYSRHLI